ncbi:MAG: homoserine O-acetyltransferase [Spirochaetales bacterium]|nr:homoserine O-acetyltransferase [Spirochaetales bacterium]MCF7937549.1 homoserine O-acetyltransferase [Spirochaetales bacterium]
MPEKNTEQDTARGSSVGVVQPQDIQLADEDNPLILDNGRSFAPINVRYETYGRLNKERSNAVLILHAFSGDAHAAGYHSPEDQKPGWWDPMIGPGRAFDTTKYFIISSNVLGGCQGTTGPASVSPETGKPYGLSFPVITIADMVRLQERLIDALGIDRLLAVAGGSMGGMQALEWAVGYPERVRSAMVLSSTARLNAQGIAFNAVGRNAITTDCRWAGGDYYGEETPSTGLAIARMIGHITYLSDESMRMKFGRRLQQRATYGYDFSDQFEVESYLQHQGDKFVDRFDANSYLYLSKAMDYFDMSESYGGLTNAFSRTGAKFLVISYSSDWLYPTYQSKEMVYAMMKSGLDVTFIELASPYGHDSFLLDAGRQTELISSFLEKAYAESTE